MSITFSEKQLLVQDLVLWMPQAKPQEILAYVAALQNQDPSLQSDLTSMLIEYFLQERNDLMRTHLNESVPRVLTDPELETVLALCQHYSPASILASYQKDHPGLSTEVASDIRKAAAEHQIAWAHVLEFATAQHFTNLQPYIDSLAKTFRENPERLIVMAEEGEAIVGKLEELSNEIQSDLIERIGTFLQELQIVPESEISQYLENPLDPEFLAIFADMTDVLSGMGSSIEGGTPIAKGLAHRALIWKMLCDRFEDELFSSNLAEKMAEDAMQETEEFRDYYRRLITTPFLRTGQALEQIQQQRRALGGDQLSKSNEALTLILLALPLSYLYLLNSTGETLEDVIAEVVDARKENRLLQFINQRTAARDPQEVPIITNLIKIIAEVF
ncbi:hypothetical protein BH11PAT4_BH11PAT4_0870 [soil metagenome]